MDITETILSNSNQLNADDLIGGPLTITITGTRTGTREQPLEIHWERSDTGAASLGVASRPYKPSKSMRRVLAHIWGLETDHWLGRRLTLYRDAAVVYGGVAVGGIRISHMSDIDEPKPLMLTTTRGKKARHVVEPLPPPPPREQESTPAAEGRSGATTLQQGTDAVTDRPEPDDYDTLERLRGDGRRAAAQGTDALKAFWAALTSDQKKALKTDLSKDWKPSAAKVDNHKTKTEGELAL